METGVVGGVPAAPGHAAPLRLQLFGPLALWRGGQPLALPPSRKVRALLAYLAMAPHAVARGTLCELLWDLPNDPRGELRWGLSKLRALLDEPGRERVVAQGDMLRLDLADAEADAPALAAAVQGGLAALPVARLQALAAASQQEFLQGLSIERSAPWTTWLHGQRRRFGAARTALLQHLAQRLPPGSDDAVAVLEQWLQRAPYDRQAHAALLQALALRGQWREGDAHLASAVRLFEAEAQDASALVRAWRDARQRPAGALDAVRVASTAGTLPGAAPPGAPGPARRASLAVMPFADDALPAAPARGGMGDALAFDVITRLAKLRSLFVIAPGTVFALDERRIGAEDAGRRLDVDYVASGRVRRVAQGRLQVGVQLVETRSARIVWADELPARGDETFAVLDEIGNRIVASIAQQVELAERQRAILKPPATLDAWEAHHRGLWHMVRFSREDNAQARRCFEAALRMDPQFSRAWAGLSFTHFQDAFLGWGDRDQAVEQAYRTAAEGQAADELDPATHWSMGRAQWLRGRQGEALAALDTSIALSPNFALGHYTRGFIHAQSGDPGEGIAACDQSRGLSPFDPLLFAMLAARALGLMRLGRHDEAAEWAVKAAARPNAHVHIQAIAAHCLALAGRLDEARAQAAAIRRLQPAYGTADLMAAFRFEPGAEGLLRTVAPAIALA